MKLRLLEHLVCPIDKTPLELVKWNTSIVRLDRETLQRIKRLQLNPEAFSTEIESGLLLNRARKIFYPIHDGIPRMLVFKTGVAQYFAETYAPRLAEEFPDFTLPSESPMPGEETVLRTFSSEWVNYDWEGDSYWSLSPESLYETMRFLLDVDRSPVKDRLVLEVGIGIGGIADYMARTQECELVGIDLSHAVDPAYRHFGLNPFFHIVQSSAFAPPFRENSFDFVYSHGVIHHTFSTKTAFRSISALPKKGGRLYVWVYSPHDEERTFERRMLMKTEKIVRPFVWRLPNPLQTAALLPFIPLYLIRQNLLPDRKQPGYIKYGFREALHAARDRFSPRYVHRHTEEEVCTWFSEAGYTDLQSLNRRGKKESIPPSFALATAVNGKRI